LTIERTIEIRFVAPLPRGQFASMAHEEQNKGRHILWPHTNADLRFPEAESRPGLVVKAFPMGEVPPFLLWQVWSEKGAFVVRVANIGAEPLPTSVLRLQLRVTEN
jgi:hypothetical protein